MTIEVTFQPREVPHQRHHQQQQPAEDDDDTLAVASRPMTLDAVRQLCRDRDDQFTTLSLNETLHLSHTGFDTAIDLAPHFPLLLTLWLDNCSLDSEWLALLPVTLKALYVDNNRVADLSWCAHLSGLTTLSVSRNPLSSLAGLSSCRSLVSLNASSCELVDASELAALHLLRDVDLSNNQLSDLAPVVDALRSSESTLRVLSLVANPGVTTLPSYRRTVLSALTPVRFMDDRPVSDDERAGVSAWSRGGTEAEREVRLSLIEEKRAKEERQFMAWQAERNRSISAKITVVSDKKRVAYRSTMNEDEQAFHQVEAEPAEQPVALATTVATVTSGEYNVLSSPSFDVILDSVVAKLPSIAAELNSDEESDAEGDDAVPFLVGLTHPSNKSDVRANATVRSLFASPTVSPLKQSPSTSQGHSRSTSASIDSSRPSLSMPHRDQESKEYNETESDDDDDDGADDGDASAALCDASSGLSRVMALISAEHSTAPLIASSDRQWPSDDESEDAGWTNSLDSDDD